MHEGYASLARQIKTWALELGFSAAAITDCELGNAETQLMAWLDQGFHGEMHYMAAHGTKRARPHELVPGTVRVITVRMDYWPPDAHSPQATLATPELAYISRYALGRDYHKVLRSRLQRLVERIAAQAGEGLFRVFTDSAPVLEVALAEKSGLGWRGKHTLLLNREHGSYFFLGEIYTSLPLPTDPPGERHCGTCTACIDACPTGAILAPYLLDARRCVSYLTIELPGSIPETLRPAIGNRIYGCDDCQLVCPWNRFARTSAMADFAVRHGLDRVPLTTLFDWDETTFETRFAGSAIRRIGHVRWLRNLAVALGNAPTSSEVVAALLRRRDHPEALVREHVGWALARHGRAR